MERRREAAAAIRPSARGSGSSHGASWYQGGCAPAGGARGETATGRAVFDVVTGKREGRDRRRTVGATALSVAAHVAVIAALLLIGRAGDDMFQKVGMGPGL